MEQQIKDFFERHAFGVCQYLGGKMNIDGSIVRRYFIYVSFISMGSPLIFYLVVAFWLNIRKYIRNDGRQTWYS